MRRKAVRAKADREARSLPDPRLSAFARLLARDLARRHFQESLDRKVAPAYSLDVGDSDDNREAP